MSKYIDAQKLLDWIKDSITMYGNTYNTDQLNMWGLFEHIIKNTPTADVEPVVRCKDCKYWGSISYNHRCSLLSGLDYAIHTQEDEYCSYGEKKSDE